MHFVILFFYSIREVILLKIFFFLIFLFSAIFSYAYEWTALGPADFEINNCYFNIEEPNFNVLCTQTGILLDEEEFNWIEYSNGFLQVWGVTGYDSESFLLVMGDGSWSDGIYKFDLNTHEFEVLEWCYIPHFILHSTYNDNYYAGYTGGLYLSENGLDWQIIEYFAGKNCQVMACYENHFVVSTCDEIFYSDDGGISWNQARPPAPWICDMTFTDTGILYGIFPYNYDVSGLYKSTNFGEHWDNEFESMMMSSVEIDVSGNIFVGWEQPSEDGEGIAIWTPGTEELTFMNEGLPNLNINKIRKNHLLDCQSIVACTDSGAYYVYDYPTLVEEKEVSSSELVLKTFPNPFHSGTMISYFTAENGENPEISIYNIKGQKVKSFYVILNGVEGSIVWDGNDDSGKKLDSGVYLVNVRVGNESKFEKLILMR